MTALHGYLQIDVPLTAEQVAEDRPFLDALLAGIPDEVLLLDARFAVNGRVYKWERVDGF